MDPCHIEKFNAVRESLIRQARKASQQANSYRGFQVGCAVLAYGPGNRAKNYRIFVGANLKPTPDGPKVCAEQIAIGSAVSHGYEQIIAIAVTGEPQPDTVSGLNPPTLHPCWECRTLLRTMPQVSEDMIILTTHNHRGPREEHTLCELLARHENSG